MIKNFTEFILERKVIVSGKGSGYSNIKSKQIDTILDLPSSPKSPSNRILLNDFYTQMEMEDEIERVLKGLEPLNPKNKNLRHKITHKDIPPIPKKSSVSKYGKWKVSVNNMKFLKDMKEEGHDMRCEYCHRGPLTIYAFDEKFKISNGATCDHKVPQSKGGDRFDYSNLAVTCQPCNKLKSNMGYDEWMEKYPQGCKTKKAIQ